MLVPDTQGTMNEFNVKMKDVEKFMSKQKLPRLVDTTPVLDENNVTVNTSKPLGRGGFGVVYKGTLKRSSTGTSVAVAVKCMFNPSGNPKDAVVPDDIKNQMRRESTILCSLNHPERDENIRRVSGVWLDRHGTVRQRVFEIDIARERNVHRNFRAHSIRRGNCDWRRVFALSGNCHRARRFESRQRLGSRKRIGLFVRFRHVRGERPIENDDPNRRRFHARRRLTVQWSSPELLKGKRKDRASDIFALAVTLWEIFERDTPFAGMADMIVINQILANVRPEIEKTPAEFRSLIQRAWTEDAKSRPNAGQIAYALSNF